ncbi:DIO2: Iodothyronine deiodinase [Crotalus adamanteus]|uniref:Iodothyronine deiodinase n=1 Tax=Crotalus adamanteus TaxID=8729 RepID=A0AAW1C7K7_CROAD
MSAFGKLVEEFSSVADFLLVYIDEAHPSDGWAAPGISSSFEVKKHRNQEDRCAAAHQLLKKFSLPPQCQIVADCMDNNANVAYGVSFERCFKDKEFCKSRYTTHGHTIIEKDVRRAENECTKKLTDGA